MTESRSTLEQNIMLLLAQFEALRVAYERFFTGIDRVEPAQLRNHFNLQLKLLSARPSVNTAFNFRLQNIKARSLTYAAMWDRALAAKEASHMGLSKRAEQSVPQVVAGASDADNLAALHADFVAAGAQTGHPSKLDFASFCAMVARHTESIKARTQWQHIGLRVVVDNGRPALKAFRRA